MPWMASTLQHWLGHGKVGQLTRRPLGRFADGGRSASAPIWRGCFVALCSGKVEGQRDIARGKLCPDNQRQTLHRLYAQAAGCEIKGQVHCFCAPDECTAGASIVPGCAAQLPAHRQAASLILSGQDWLASAQAFTARSPVG